MTCNFLFFIVDQLCATHLGCYGNPIAATPVIDGLAAGGWRAQECHVATPICMPNRASLLTGRMPSVHGVRHNGIPLSLAAVTIADLLRDAGYATSLIGKSHLQNMTAKPPLLAKDAHRPAREAQRPYPGNYQQECQKTWETSPAFEMELPFYGFDHVQLAIGHGDASEGHYRRWLQAEHPELAHKVGRQHSLPAPGYELVRHGQAWRSAIPEELHPTAWIADQTIAQLREAQQRQRPFFLYSSFADPHHPYTPPGRYWDLYRPEDMALPPSFHADTPPPHLAWLRAQREAGRAVKNTMACYAATEREVREAIALGLGSLSFIDAQIGRVLAALSELGLDDDTVVVFTSDHGEFAGDHQLLFKGSLHYQSLTRTPFIWRDPQRVAPGGRADRSLLSTIDIAPTLLERAGIERFNGMQGRSFLPAICGEPRQQRDALLIEEEGQRTYFGFERPVRMRTLLTQRHRLSVYDGVSWGELYDRLEDPHETRNLWDEPSARTVRESLVARLSSEMLAHTETSPAATALA